MQEVLKLVLIYLVSPALVGVVVLLVSDWYHKRPDGRVRVNCSFATIEYLPKIFTELENRNSEVQSLERSRFGNIRMWTDAVLQDIHHAAKTPLPGNLTEQMANNAAGIKRECDEKLPVEQVGRPVTGIPLRDWPKGIWTIDVMNHGKKPAKDHRLVIPHGKWAMVRRAGLEPHLVDIDELLTLGDVHPGEPIVITVWTARDYGSIGKDVTSSFDHGVARTTMMVDAPRTLVRRIALVRDAWMLFVFISVAVLLITVTALIMLGAHLAKTTT